MRTRAALVVGLTLALDWTLALAQQTASDLPFTFQSNVMIPMRDGTQLAANIFLPKQGGPFPVVLQRTPYGKPDAKSGEARPYCAAGYGLVVQDCRGRGNSQGQWDPFRFDGNDGFDTQEWVGHPWRANQTRTTCGSKC